MTRKKITNRDLVLSNKVGVRFDKKTFMKLKELVQRTNSQSVGELVRRIVEKDKIHFYAVDATMKEPIEQLCRIQKELNMIGNNINQVVHFFNRADNSTDRVFRVMGMKQHITQLQQQISELFSLISPMAKKWLDQPRALRIELTLENFVYNDEKKQK